MTRYCMRRRIRWSFFGFGLVIFGELMAQVLMTEMIMNSLNWARVIERKTNKLKIDDNFPMLKFNSESCSSWKILLYIELQLMMKLVFCIQWWSKFYHFFRSNSSFRFYVSKYHNPAVKGYAICHRPSKLSICKSIYNYLLR